SLDLFRRLGDRRGEAVALAQLGDTQHITGDVTEARRFWRQALEILDHLGHPEADEVRGKLAGLGVVPEKSATGPAREDPAAPGET
ncbi:hypothetical protein, partial [Plantactinospora mayteni]|uniref:hypothetical protein n=1 Tax=Plantactinospora mayteni TaxID=566021 RepID=UPI001941EA12